MPSPSAFNPSTDVSFIIRNNSSIGRSIKVFNTRIPPGGTLDLMDIPGVTEEDIRVELTKGSLKTLFAGGSLVVVSSTVNFGSSDGPHGAFLSSIGINVGTSSSTALTQATWFIDPINGVNTNTGLTSSTALKTFAELSRRWGNGNTLAPPGTNGTVPVFVTVNIMSSLPSTDPLTYNVALGPQVQLQFVGATPTQTSLTVSAVRTKVRSSNTPWALTVSTPATSVATRILDVTQSGYFWGVKDETAGVLRISEPFKPPVLVASGTYPQLLSGALRFTPLNTDTFATQTLVSVTCGSMIVSATRGPTSNSGIRGSVVFIDLQLDNSDPVFINSNGVNITFYGCLMTRDLSFGPSLALNLINCCHARSGGSANSFHQTVGAFPLWEGGAFINVSPAIVSSTLRVDFDTIFQTCALVALSGTRWLLGNVGIFDGRTGGPGQQNPTGDGIRLAPGGIAVSCIDVDTTNTLWGSGSVGAGIGLGGGSSFQWQGTLVSAPLSITGSTPGTNDFAFRGITGSGTITSAYTMSSAGVVGGPHTDSWSNFFNVSNFGGTAFNPPTNSWIVPSGITV